MAVRDQRMARNIRNIKSKDNSFIFGIGLFIFLVIVILIVLSVFVIGDELSAQEVASPKYVKKGSESIYASE